MKINSLNAMNTNKVNKRTPNAKKIGTIAGAVSGMAFSVYGFRDSLARNPLKDSNPKAALLIAAAFSAVSIAAATLVGRLNGAIIDKVAAKKANSANTQK